MPVLPEEKICRECGGRGEKGEGKAGVASQQQQHNNNMERLGRGEAEEHEARFAMPAEEYLERFHVRTYLQDALTQMLRGRAEGPRETALEFVASYFASGVCVCASE